MSLGGSYTYHGFPGKADSKFFPRPGRLLASTPSFQGLFVLSGSIGGTPPRGCLPTLWSFHRTVEALQAILTS